MRSSQSAASHSLRSHVCGLRGIFCDAHVAKKMMGIFCAAHDAKSATLIIMK